MYFYIQCPQHCSRPPPTHASARDSRTPRGKSGSVSYGALFPSPEFWHTRYHLCPPRVYFLVPCKFWHLYSGVNCDLLQEGLCHIQDCCMQSPCPHSSPLLTHTSTGDAQTQFCLSLCGVPRSWCSQGLPKPSQRPQWECCLIPNANSPLLRSCWSLSPTLGGGASPHSCSSAYSLTGVSLSLNMGYLLMLVQ